MIKGVTCFESVDTFSDHLPLAFELILQTPLSLYLPWLLPPVMGSVTLTPPPLVEWIGTRYHLIIVPSFVASLIFTFLPYRMIWYHIVILCAKVILCRFWTVIREVHIPAFLRSENVANKAFLVKSTQYMHLERHK